MLAINRKKKIKEMIVKKGDVSVNELSKLLTVTEETVRKDLQLLEKEGFLKRAYGGAYLNDSKNLVDLYNLSFNSTFGFQNKVVSYLNECVVENDVIFLDDSFISQEFILNCPKKIKVFTNSLSLALVGEKNSNISIYLFGGSVVNQNIVVDSLDVLDKYSFNTAIFTSCFLDNFGNFFIENDSFFKQKIIEKSNFVITYVDELKTENPVFLCSSDLVTHVISENKNLVKEYERFAEKFAII